PIRAGSNESAVPLPLEGSPWRPVDPKNDISIVTYQVDLPDDFLKAGAPKSKTFISIVDWKGPATKGKIIFHHILGYRPTEGQPYPLGFDAVFEIGKGESHPIANNLAFRINLQELSGAGLVINNALAPGATRLRDGALEFLLADRLKGIG